MLHLRTRHVLLLSVCIRVAFLDEWLHGCNSLYGIPQRRPQTEAVRPAPATADRWPQQDSEATLELSRAERGSQFHSPSASVRWLSCLSTHPNHKTQMSTHMLTRLSESKRTWLSFCIATKDPAWVLSKGHVPLLSFCLGIVGCFDGGAAAKKLRPVCNTGHVEVALWSVNTLFRSANSPFPKRVVPDTAVHAQKPTHGGENQQER